MSKEVDSIDKRSLQLELYSFSDHNHESYMNVPKTLDQLGLYEGCRRNVVTKVGEIKRKKNVRGHIHTDYLLHPSSSLDPVTQETLFTFPAARERRIMDALKKISTDDGMSQIGKHYVVKFTLRQLQATMSSDLKSKSIKFNTDEIKEGLRILQSSNIDIYIKNIKTGEVEEHHSPQLQSLYIYEKGKNAKPVTELGENVASDTYCSALFHPLITRDINSLEYRQLNCLTLNSFSSASVGHTLYRHMVLKFTQASRENTYSLKVSTARDWAGLKIDKTQNFRDSKDPVIRGFEELKRLDIIESYTFIEEYKERVGGSRKKKLVDELYMLKMTDSFIKEQIRANAIQLDLNNRLLVASNISPEHKRAIANNEPADFSLALQQPSSLIEKAAEKIIEKNGRVEKRIN